MSTSDLRKTLTLVLELTETARREKTTRKPPRPWGPLATVLAFMLLAFAITLFLLTVAGALL